MSTGETILASHKVDRDPAPSSNALNELAAED
jgi:hypothetical protein